MYGPRLWDCHRNCSPCSSGLYRFPSGCGLFCRRFATVSKEPKMNHFWALWALAGCNVSSLKVVYPDLVERVLVWSTAAEAQPWPSGRWKELPVCVLWAIGWGTREASHRSFLSPLSSSWISGHFWSQGSYSPRHLTQGRRSITVWEHWSGCPLSHARVFYFGCSHISIFGTTAQLSKLCCLSPHVALAQLTL